ncbi:MAG TPA: DUF4296 domain-containing protein [Draconibacterium sp.]|nr:DUF4296 domain-containing protein [Draconibacterium sp.]
MRNVFIIILFVLFAFVSCEEPPAEKPKHLIKENQMIDMIIDVQLAQAMYNSRHNADTLLKRTTPADFYYSVLDKYNVPDSLFEKSFIYYASSPKKFEKMYRKVMSKLSEMEQEYSDRPNERIDLGGKVQR